MIALEKSVAVLTRRIRQREETLGEMRDGILDRWSDYLAEVLLQGRDLLEVKATLKHGQWLPWLATHAKISEAQAQRYMQLAANPARVRDFMEAGSLRKSLELLRLPSDGGGSAVALGTVSKQPFPPYLESIARLSKPLKYMALHPVSEWPDEGKESLREKLQPIAAALWPDKFS